MVVKKKKKRKKRSLENLAIEPDKYGPLLIPILLPKIPDELKLLISRKFNNDECWDIKIMLDTIKSEVKAREKASFTNNDFQQHSARTFFSGANSSVGDNSKSAKIKIPNTVHKNNSKSLADNTDSSPLTQEKCVFCEKDHKSHQCTTVTNIAARKNILKQKRRCFKCLRSGHLSRQCNTRMRCFHCSYYHHAAVCLKKFPLHADDAKEQNGQLTSVAGVLSQHTRVVLLQTAIAFVGFSETNSVQKSRILFDGCSQLSYITTALRNKLNLKTVSTKEIEIRTFGNRCVIERLDKVLLNVKTSNNSFVPISCFVKDICAPIDGQFINTAVEKYSHLKGLVLADNNVENTSLSVDILIGSDFYWDFIGNEVVRGELGPVALESKLGFILSGNLDMSPNKGCSVLSSHVLKVGSVISSDEALRNDLIDLWSDEHIENADEPLSLSDFQ